MTDPLEHDVREALRRKAASVPNRATERLSSIDYNPRTASWQPTCGGAIASFTRTVRRLRPWADSAFMRQNWTHIEVAQDDSRGRRD
jgi:hypothetical protein